MQLSLREQSCCWRPLSPKGQLCCCPNQQLAFNPKDAAKWYQGKEELAELLLRLLPGQQPGWGDLPRISPGHNQA